MDLGRKLRILRKSYGYSQLYVARKLHISRTTYSNYENNKVYMDYFVIEQIIKLYSIDAHYLFDNNATSNDTTLANLLEIEKTLLRREEKEKFWRFIANQSKVYVEFLNSNN